MNASELELFLDSYKGYTGVYPKFLLPPLENVGDFSIINTSCHPCVSPLSPRHWVVIFKYSATTYYYFDSYGKSPSFHGLKIQKELNTDLLYNIRQVQSNFSNICGIYCLIFCRYVIKKRWSFYNFLSLFEDNYKANDDFVIKLFTAS